MEVELRNKLKQLALLDAIIEPEWEYRYYSYNSNWSDTEEIAAVANGSFYSMKIIFHSNVQVQLMAFLIISMRLRVQYQKDLTPF